jgi:hypothetical protein
MGAAAQMNEDQKRQFDAIASLRSWAWQSFDRRRDFEWKVGIAIWTSLAALIGILLTKDIPAQDGVIKWGAVVFAVMLLSLHARFSLGVSRGNSLDRDQQQWYDALLDKQFGPFLTPELKVQIEKQRQRTGIIRLFTTISTWRDFVTAHLLRGTRFSKSFHKSPSLSVDSVTI